VICSQDADDLPFEKGEVLMLIRKDEEQWWTAMNNEGRKGLVPVPYIEKVRCTHDYIKSYMMLTQV